MRLNASNSQQYPLRYNQIRPHAACANGLLLPPAHSDNWNNTDEPPYPLARRSIPRECSSTAFRTYIAYLSSLFLSMAGFTYLP